MIKILIEQQYNGIEDYEQHFYAVLPAFKDKRYIKVDNKPLFVIYRPLANPEIKKFIRTWRNLARENGLNGIYFVGHCHVNTGDIHKFESIDLDAINILRLNDFLKKRNIITRIIYKIYRLIFKFPYTFSYKKAAKYFFDINIDTAVGIIPTIVTGWDHTPRSRNAGLVLTGYTPELFKKYAELVIRHINKDPGIIFIKSWNEWAEGNYLEPDLKWGRNFLYALRSALDEGNTNENSFIS
jgi:hypothetical protein